MKKQNSKKAVSVTLALLVSSTAVLAACSTPASKQAAPNADADSGKEAAQAKGPKPKITVSVYDRNNVPEGEGTITNNRWTKWINEKAPVQVEFIPIPRTSSTEKFNVMFASGEAPDLIMEFTNSYTKDLASKGQIIPLDEPIEKYSTTYKKFLKENPVIQKSTLYNGKTYFFGRLLPFTPNHYLMIRKDWLDKLKLPVPKTTEEYLQTAKAFTDQDPDGNGKKDTLGTTFHDIEFFYQFDPATLSAYLLQNDQYVRSWDRAKAVIDMKKKLYDAGTVDKDIFADKTGAKAQQDWVNGKLGIYGSDNLEGTKGYGVYDTFKKNNPDGEVMILPMPKSEFGQFAPATSTPVQFNAAINATAKNVEAVIKYVDWLVSEETQKTLMFGFEGEHYKMENGCPKPIDAAKNKKELSWNGDYQMLSNTALFGKCADFSNQLDPNKPLDQQYMKLMEQGRAAYVSPDRPLHVEVLIPQTLPDDLLVINNTVKNTITNIYTKAVVGGSSYTVDQAMKDAMDAWDKAGGKKIDSFYAQAYTDNKKDVVYTKDFYKYMQK
ncbi:extracellular solute-binding protein [Paenibacillus periandrae]|uniref:extracellular solute-binding protein n=1 Tax=Paenibacillus periandrae TaxID=1761741 RepID=UPI001F08F068|nr:extracellular solute-binding protein [Paenibacillus periandrae]